MANIVKANEAKAPVVYEQSSLVKDEDFDDLGAGIKSSFPIIGYRQTKWRLRWQGEEQLIVDERGTPVQEIGVSLIKVNDHKSKRLWIEGYTQNSRKAPDCWSHDGIRPDPALTPPVQPNGAPIPTQCSQCYFDSIGSLVSADKKKKMKACGDYKRIAVKLYYPEIPFEELSNSPMLLTVPAASLKALKLYGEELKAHNAHAIARITYIGFDDEASYQKLTFRAGPALSDEEYLAVSALRKTSAAVRDILNEESALLDTGAYPEGEASENGVTEQAQPVAPAPAVPVQRLKPAPQSTVKPVQTPRDPDMTVAYRPPQPAAATAQRYAPGARAINPKGGIAEAIATPAAPPPSARAVVTEEATDGYAEVPEDMETKFNRILGAS